MLRLAIEPSPNTPVPGRARPRSPQVVRSDSAGATHHFAKAYRETGVGFGFGFPITPRCARRSPRSVPLLGAGGRRRRPAREGAFVAEVTKLIDLPAWPEGSRVIVRRERPHPGAQLACSTRRGFRHTAFIFAPRDARERERRPGRLGAPPPPARPGRGPHPPGKAAGLKNLPCAEAEENDVWLECVLAAADLVCWSKLLCFANDVGAGPLRNRRFSLQDLAHGCPNHRFRAGGAAAA